MTAEHIAKTKSVLNRIKEKGVNLEEVPGLEQAVANLFPRCKQPFLPLKCPFCGRIHERRLYYVTRALLKKIYLPTKFCCSDPNCVIKNKAAVIAEQTRLGKTSAQGHIVTQKQIEKHRATLFKNNRHLWWHEFKRGKTLEEIYGEEKGAFVRRKIKENTPNMGGFFKGKHHTVDIKASLSKKSSDYFKSDAYLSDKKYVNELTGEKCSHREWLATHNKLMWAKKTESEKLDKLTKQLSSLQKGALENHPYWGFHKAWFESTPTQPFRSSWELKYMEYLDSKKVFYESNKSFYIPYNHPVKGRSFYVPDFLLYDGLYVTEVIEIKPKKLTFAETNMAKFNAAREVCNKNNITFSVLTEDDLSKLGIALPNYKTKVKKYFRRDYENSKDNKIF